MNTNNKTLILEILSKILDNYNNLVNFEKVSTSDLRNFFSDNEKLSRNLIKIFNNYKKEIPQLTNIKDKNIISFVKKEINDINLIISNILKVLQNYFNIFNNKLKPIINNAPVYKTRLSQDKKIQSEKEFLTKNIEIFKEDINNIKKLLHITDNKIKKINKLINKE